MHRMWNFHLFCSCFQFQLSDDSAENLATWWKKTSVCSFSWHWWSCMYVSVIFWLLHNQYHTYIIFSHLHSPRNSVLLSCLRVPTEAKNIRSCPVLSTSIISVSNACVYFCVMFWLFIVLSVFIVFLFFCYLSLWLLLNKHLSSIVCRDVYKSLQYSRVITADFLKVVCTVRT